MKSFAETKPFAGFSEFESDDWKAADTLARSLTASDFTTGHPLLDGSGTTSQMRLSRQLKANQGIADLQLVYSTVLQRIKDSTFSGLLMDARAALGRRTYKHSNPYALVAEATLGIDRAEACRKGAILQAATREMVSPKKLGKFIRKLGGLSAAYGASRALLNNLAPPPKPTNLRLSVVLPNGEDLRSLIESGEEIALAVKPQKGGSPALVVSHDPLAVKLLKRLARDSRVTGSVRKTAIVDEWDK
jgi:hypothetical protein